MNASIQSMILITQTYNKENFRKDNKLIPSFTSFSPAITLSKPLHWRRPFHPPPNLSKLPLPTLRLEGIILCYQHHRLLPQE